MPREAVPGEGGAFEIGWGRDTNTIEVVTSAGYDGARRVVATVNEWLNLAGLPPVDLDELGKKMAELGADPTVPSVAPYFSGFHVHLGERRAVNDLIRHLQRARDMAFGRDA